MEPTGTILFNTVGRAFYCFDIFAVELPRQLDEDQTWSEHRLTDGVSINFNGQFVDDHKTLVYISERTGSPRIFLNQSEDIDAEHLYSPPESLFHDRPVIKNRRLYFISAHEQPEKPFTSWSALYSTMLDDKTTTRLTPYGTVDYSPAVSPSGKLIAVASYGRKAWGGEFHEIDTDIVVFSESDPTSRAVVCQHGGWPSWWSDSILYFHREAEDGWWSIFRADLSHDFASSPPVVPVRITPPGVHCFTPAAVHGNKRIVVATRRNGKNYRHIEIFDTESQKFQPVTELLNPNHHHYNPFVSPGATFLGYHRFRGTGAGDSAIPYIERVNGPVKGLNMVRLVGSFPAFSPSGDLIAMNVDFDQNSGLKIVKSDGSKMWTLFGNRIGFYNSWSPAHNNVIFTSIGPIFESSKAHVQIARVTFDPTHLNPNRKEIHSEIKILTREDTGNNAFPSSSPDGKFVVFRSGRSGHKNLYIVDATIGEFDGGIRRLTEGAWIDTMPSWSPDGKLIAFSSNRHNPENVEAFGIYLMEADGSGARRVKVAGFDEARERLNHVCFSGDGEWLAFAANLGGVTAEPVAYPNQFQPYGDLYAVRLDGSGLRRLTFNGFEDGTPVWGPNIERHFSMTEDEEHGLEGEFEDPLWIKCHV
ncbi:uncharacterized protein LOC131007270 [Salvia miltiorrhiza]|uniref:uncharacterized protein LOC131007270 n=1 Tax=Salvia miltiorrhiza TaxID=226208 RepID=UPI0025ACD4CC|nr:uncharacterized protein LOC131007270 [Salvia miltiorrhiza]